jgi:hypothetical protein
MPTLPRRDRLAPAFRRYADAELMVASALIAWQRAPG